MVQYKNKVLPDVLNHLFFRSCSLTGDTWLHALGLAELHLEPGLSRWELAGLRPQRLHLCRIAI